MPRGPNGEKRPAGTVANAVHVMRIATGQVEDETPSKRREAGRRGGQARANALSPQRRQEIARMGAEARHRKAS